MPINITGTSYPQHMPNPVSMHQGLIIKGNVFVNFHRTYPSMSLGLGPCVGTGLPCDPTNVSLMLDIAGMACACCVMLPTEAV
jgi:hypothetical protein